MSKNKSDSGDEVETELQCILDSALFSKAYRSSALLLYLVRNREKGNAKNSSEYKLGIDVFGRSPASYNPSDDPIVRVQVGRLRSKLSTYYESEGSASSIRMSIPVGSHKICIEMLDVTFTQASVRMAFRPLVCLSREYTAQVLTMGVNEELSYCLYRNFGNGMTSGQTPNTWPKTLREITINYLLEGSMRKDGKLVRISLRLLDLVQDRLAWSEQLDHEFDASISSQERLANACSEALRKYMALP